jgi:Raf kinase inhibitor-like YbhB/YbcL family protein
MNRFIGLFCLFIMFIEVGCEAKNTPATSEGSMDMTIQISSSEFSEGGSIPRQFTCDDVNVSPPLSWTGVPTHTLSLTLIVDDPDAPAGTWVHWVLYNLPPELSGLAQGMTGIGVEGMNDFRRLGYGGPCPPKGPTHRYYFKIYALDTILDLKPGATKTQVELAMQGHILAQGRLMGKYGR